MKVLFVCSHQIQNLIPLFVELNKKKDFNFKVIYWEKLTSFHYDEEFKKQIDFNINFYRNYDFVSLSKEKNKTKSFFSFFNKIRISINLIKYFFKNDFNTVIFYGYYFPHVISAILLKILGKKTILRSVSYNLGKRNLLKKVIRYFYYRLSNLFFDEFWSICKLNTDFFLSFGVKKEKIFLIPSSQITKEFIFNENEKFLLNNEKIVEDNKLSKNKKFILFAGKFNSQKRPLFLINSFINAQLGNEWNLIMSGGGGIFHDDVLKFINKNNLSNVSFVGYKNLREMIGLYTISDIVVLPSDYGETHGNVLMEAIQFECALIASDRTGIYPEILREQMGLVFKAAYKSDLIEKFKLLTKDKELLLKLKKNGIKYSEKIKPLYAADKMSELLLKK